MATFTDAISPKTSCGLDGGQVEPRADWSLRATAIETTRTNPDAISWRPTIAPVALPLHSHNPQARPTKPMLRTKTPRTRKPPQGNPNAVPPQEVGQAQFSGIQIEGIPPDVLA